MAKRGRKPKAFPRTPSGQLSRSQVAMIFRTSREETMNQPHRALVPEAMRGDQRAESVLGRLYLKGHITQAECWAGEKWRALMAEFSRVLCTPVTKGSVLASMISEPAAPPADFGDPVDEVQETPEERHARVFERYDSAMHFIDLFENSDEVQKLKKTRDEKWFGVLEDVVVHEMAPAKEQIIQLGQILHALAFHWKIKGDDAPRPLRGKRSERPTWDHDERELLIQRKALA